MRLARTASLAFMLLILVGAAPGAFGQTGTVNGIPPHQIVESHQYDAINVADLGTTITIPILNKKGPIPFSYALKQRLSAG